MTNNDLVKRLRAWARDAQTGRNVSGVDLDLKESADRIEQLEAERDEAVRLMSYYAREAGEAQGVLEASEMAGVVRGWKEKAERLEAENRDLRVDIEIKRKKLEDTTAARQPMP